METLYLKIIRDKEEFALENRDFVQKIIDCKSDFVAQLDYENPDEIITRYSNILNLFAHDLANKNSSLYKKLIVRYAQEENPNGEVSRESVIHSALDIIFALMFDRLYEEQNGQIEQFDIVEPIKRYEYFRVTIPHELIVQRFPEELYDLSLNSISGNPTFPLTLFTAHEIVKYILRLYYLYIIRYRNDPNLTLFDMEIGLA